MHMFQALWAYRDFIYEMVKREFRGRYTRSLLGGLWAIIDPLSMIFIYTLIFSQLMSSRLPGVNDIWGYSIHLCAGIITWEYFIEVINRAQNMFLDQANLLKKINFPRSTLPMIVLLTATINFMIIFGLLLLFLLLIAHFPGWVVLGILPLLVIQQTIALGLGLILGTLNVFFRDISYMTGIILRFWFWLTPIVYPITILPDTVRDIVLYWNPMSIFIVGYQQILLTKTLPIWLDYLPYCFLAMALLAIGFFVYSKLSAEMTDEL